jgi:hypothetical protein
MLLQLSLVLFLPFHFVCLALLLIGADELSSGDEKRADMRERVCERTDDKKVSRKSEREIRNKCMSNAVLSKTQLKRTLIAEQEQDFGTGRVM